MMMLMRMLFIPLVVTRFSASITNTRAHGTEKKIETKNNVFQLDSDDVERAIAAAFDIRATRIAEGNLDEESETSLRCVSGSGL